ncbi:MAG: type II secretion system protein, partial [Phascolarctobacterium sp.]|nr:type II secretion system protein [Phascolarctobacterium sp.]
MVAKRLNKQAGFLLVEVLAVVALLGILAGVLLPQS